MTRVLPVTAVSNPSRDDVAVPDIGLTHVALSVSDSERSAAFYTRYADMRIAHRRPAHHGSGDVLWLTDGTRPFVIVLIPADLVEGRFGGNSTHLGVGVGSREEVDTRLTSATKEGLETFGPIDAGPPVGYFGTIDDPDGHTLELSYGQEVAVILERPAPSPSA
jgi:catechol 2,3-dioxygenase-like lactoylglutathione lyase family enzyme